MNTSALSSSPSIKPLQPPQQPGAIFNLTIKKNCLKKYIRLKFRVLICRRILKLLQRVVLWDVDYVKPQLFVFFSFSKIVHDIIQ